MFVIALKMPEWSRTVPATAARLLLKETASEYHVMK